MREGSMALLSGSFRTDRMMHVLSAAWELRHLHGTGDVPELGTSIGGRLREGAGVHHESGAIQVEDPEVFALAGPLGVAAASDPLRPVEEVVRSLVARARAVVQVGWHREVYLDRPAPIQLSCR